MLSVKKDLYPCIQFSGCGLFRYLICFATHTLVNQCQFFDKKVLSHFSILININRFHPYFNYSPFLSFLFFYSQNQNSSFLTILSHFKPIKDLLRCPTCITAAAGTGFGQDI